MKRLAIALVFTLVAGACGGGDDTVGSTSATDSTSSSSSSVAGPQVVESPDGLLSLEVPADGVDVTITEIDAEAAGVEDAFEVLGAYEFGPSGATFDPPLPLTFDTGVSVEGDTELPFYVVALEDENGEFEILDVEIDADAPTAMITAEVPHFSKVVVLGSRGALLVHPREIFAVAPALWIGDWDIFDRRYLPMTNGPARFDYRWPSPGGSDFSPISQLVSNVQVRVEPFATGVVQAATQAELDAFGLELERVGSTIYTPTDEYFHQMYAPSFLRGGGSPVPEWVEIYYGQGLFSCDQAGDGRYGFRVTLEIPGGQAKFLVSLPDGRAALYVPSGGASLVYRKSAPATCSQFQYRNVSRLLGMTLAFGDRATVKRILEGMKEDLMTDGIWSISTTTPGLFPAGIDIWDTGFYSLDVDQITLDVTLNYSLLECDATRAFPEMEGLEVTTVCADEVEPIPEGDVVIVPVTFSGPVSADGDGNEYVHSVVWESNGDPSDDWQFQGQFDWDFFQGADRWYQLYIHADGSKEISVTQTLGPPLPSGVRAFITGDSIVWVIPRGELTGDDPLGRVSSFVHDGSFNPATGGGDVNGADPTEPLTPITPIG